LTHLDADPCALPIDRGLLDSLCQRFQVEQLALFGSILRDDFRPDSDVDVLVRFRTDAEREVFDLIHMREALERLFDRRVDLVVEAALRNPFRRASILGSKQLIYAA
jgi:predicted nucleotidyltransferase